MTSIHQSLFLPVSRWTWPLSLAAVCIALALGGDAVRSALRWQADALWTQPWRLLTGHLLHLDGKHLMLNLAGLAALWALVGDAWSRRAWSIAAPAIALAVSLGLRTDPALDWYVGLSGLLHGLLAMGALGLRREWPAGMVILLGFLLVKGVSEAVLGAPQPDTVVAAHWWGAGAGLLAGILAASTQRGRAA